MASEYPKIQLFRPFYVAFHVEVRVPGKGVAIGDLHDVARNAPIGSALQNLIASPDSEPDHFLVQVFERNAGTWLVMAAIPEGLEPSEIVTEIHRVLLKHGFRVSGMGDE